MGWIKCSERMPEKDGEYLVYRPGYAKTVYSCSFSTGLNKVLPDEEDEDGNIIEFESPRPGWWDEEIVSYDGGYQSFEVHGITHWMPFPEPPKD